MRLRARISHDWVTPDAPNLTARWIGPALTEDQLPALVCDDGALRRRASCRDVAEHLGLQTRPRAAEYDTVIIGGGPAGFVHQFLAHEERAR